MPNLTKDFWSKLVREQVQPAFKSQLPADAVDHMNWVFARLVAEGWDQHKTEWAVRRVTRFWSRFDNFMSMLEKAVDGHEGRDGQWVGAYIDSDEYKAERVRLNPPHKPDEPLDFHLRAILALREANAQARLAGMSLIVEPEAWLQFEPWKPDPTEAAKLIVPQLVEGKRDAGMRRVGDVLAGKSRRVLNVKHPRFAEIMDALLLVFSPADIEELFSNGSDVVKNYQARTVRRLDYNFEPSVDEEVL